MIDLIHRAKKKVKILICRQYLFLRLLKKEALKLNSLSALSFFPHRNNGNGLVVLSLDFFALESHAMPTKKFQNGTT